MSENEIIAEIHRQREELARACGNDVLKLMDHYRQREQEHADGGHELVSYVQPVSVAEAPGALREEPPEK